MINYTNATELLEQGRTKDAYTAFLSIVELSTQQLHGVKFVQQTIVSKPTEYENALLLLKSSVDQLEKITVLPGARSSPVLTKKSPPPLPPKPTKATKPVIPPRPTPLVIDTRVNRSRGNSVSFAKELDVIEENTYDILLNKELDDDDDDDLEIEFNVSEKRLFFKKKDDFTEILMATVVDPSHLVPAQTNTRDSLTLPSNNRTEDYIPNIPSPPLLATHRGLQEELKEAKKTGEYALLEKSLAEVRSIYMSAMTIPSIMQFTPQLVAYQLTLIESAIFKNIPKQALMTHTARTPHRKIAASTDFFNFITRSIEHTILLPQEAAHRAEIINRWIKIATSLSVLHNYQTLKAVVAALGTPPIQRLRRTWDCIPKKRMARLDLFSTLMSESDNYQKYREHVGKIGRQPFVPFLGVFIHDMTYLSAAGCKEGMVQDALDTFELYQHAPDFPQQPPASFVMPKKNLTNSLHFGSKKNAQQQPEVEIEQQLITQYLLMRPWVSEKTIDTLSLVREPAKRRSISSPTTTRFSMDNNSSSTDGSPTLYSAAAASTSPTTNSNPPLVRHEDAEKKSLFWPLFRKSTELSRTSVNTDMEQMWRTEQEGAFKNRASRSLSLPPPKDFDFI